MEYPYHSASAHRSVVELHVMLSASARISSFSRLLRR